MAEITLEVHPSEVNSALLCELRLDESQRSNHPNYDMMRGSVVHDMVEKSMKRGVIDAWDFMDGRLAEEYQTTREEMKVPDPVFKILILEARLAFESWLDNVVPNLNLVGVTAVEVEHRQPIGEFVFGDDLLEVVLVGSPDLIDASPRIHDWKTGNRVWDPVKLVSQAQPPLYNYLAFGAERQVPFTFWVWEVPSSTWTPLSVTPTRAQVDEMVSLAFRLAIKRHLGLLTANPGPVGVYGKSRHWHCSPKYCDSWNGCSARKLFNDGNDDVIADWKEGWMDRAS